MTTRTDFHSGPAARAADLPARAITSTVRAAVRHRLALSAIGLGLVLLLGIAYHAVAVFGLNADDTISVRIRFADSGGLLADREVTVRGVKVGSVSSVELDPDGVVAVLSIDADAHIPRDSPVRVAGLSFAGEQYVDFRPATSNGPYLTDGTEITANAPDSTPTPLATLLDDLDGMLAQIDTDQLATIRDELGVSTAGPEKLRDIIDGGTFLISTLDSVLPQTTSLIKSSRVVLTTLGDGSAAIGETARNLDTLFTGVSRSVGGYRTLLKQTPPLLSSIDAIIADNSPTMVQLLGNLATVTQLVYQRLPALNDFFFPASGRGSVLKALTYTMHDGGIWGALNVYPRASCDYLQLPRFASSEPSFPEPYLYTFCPNNDPSVLIRGARNAPRPPGDDTNTLPEGADPRARATPTPTGPLSIPLPFAGPVLPNQPNPLPAPQPTIDQPR
ncbi:MCE family protein [Gordonia pseudamarae]|jgi:virulence factor Mce-like protein|uniref:MCE family protein n=1 Tax=Gordonia pseudamarae TaxID=2831662 RepID=A0ABX6IEQ1_9ACTN|nr:MULTISPECIES: MlaD family protein [Gordonia]MBD0021654.1 MCE family protein [Gordonia sp. (in: high G+C Gram-positive bacteria)]QHN25362.1 MCE family protein [Gordonia pseudamarae]QHN34294.1 MCE family protein [Gordonia pseudamarae]